VKGSFYIGPRFNYRNLSANLDFERTTVTLPPGLNPSDLAMNFSSHAPGVKLQHDTRSDTFYPTTGHQLELVADFFSAKRTSGLIQDKDLSYQSYQLSYNHYLSLTPTQVLAVRGSICDVTGDPPFYELCLFGTSSDIRGYQPGRYRDHLMAAAQSEYRKTLGKRWGFVLFGGVGEVAPDWNAFTTDDLLPGGGAGIRWNLSGKQRINLRGDIAYGKTGWSWNFAVGEAF
jgi:outer membrane protein assembly factor BamA